MVHKGRSRLEPGDECLTVVVARIERALASLGEAEINLRNLRVSLLPRVAESLAAAAADVELLRSALQAADHDRVNAVAVRNRMKRLECASGRVSALYRAANSFHAGWMLARKQEVAEYDVLGEFCGTPGCRVPRHCLETRG